MRVRYSHMSLPETSPPNSASPKHVLYSEILSVTSAMRRNSRWASSVHIVTGRNPTNLGSNLGLRISAPASSTLSSRRSSREVELMSGFHELKRTIQGVQGKSTRPRTRYCLTTSRHQRYRPHDTPHSFLRDHPFSSVNRANNFYSTLVVA